MHNIIRWGSRFLKHSSPTMLIATGAALALTLPPVRRGLRSALVLTTRGLLRLTDQVQYLGATMKEELEDVVAEAREGKTHPSELSTCFKKLGHSTRRHFRRMAVTAAGGALAVSDQAHRLGKKLKAVAEDTKEKPAQSAADTHAEDIQKFRDGLDPV